MLVKSIGVVFKMGVSAYLCVRPHERGRLDGLYDGAEVCKSTWDAYIKTYRNGALFYVRYRASLGSLVDVGAFSVS